MFSIEPNEVSSPSFPASLLTRYLPLQVIGTGSFANVWRAEHVGDGRIVAVKVLLEEHSTNEEAVARFLHEARVGARLRHPSFVRVEEYGVAEGVPYLITALVAGPTLKYSLTRGPLPVADAVCLGSALAAALQELHRFGIIHRDLKPDNILLPRPKVPIVLDFGFAKSPNLSFHTARGIVLGSAGYVAPELFEGSFSSPASDQYSLGVVIYEMLTGRRPFARGAISDEVAARLTETPVPVRDARPEVPAEISDVIGRMLSRRPRDRFTNLRAVRRALSAAAMLSLTRSRAAELDTLRISMGTAASGPRHRARRKGHLAGAVALAALLLLLTALVLG